MNGKKTIIILGVVIMIMGIIFHLQGLSIIGPKSSFMYSNQEWVTNGIKTFVSGGIILAIGIMFNFIKKKTSYSCN